MPSSLRAEVLGVLLRALSQDGQPCFPATATFTDANGAEVTYRFVRYDILALNGVVLAETEPGNDRGIPRGKYDSSPGNVEPLKLRRLHRRLVEVATDKPVTTKTLVRLSGYPLHSDSRSAVTALVRAGHLRRTEEGIVRGRVPLPDCQVEADEPEGDESPA